MKEQSFSAMLRNLAWEYYNRRLGIEDYRVQRRAVLDEIDREYNGDKNQVDSASSDDDESRFMGTVAFMAHKQQYEKDS